MADGVKINIDGDTKGFEKSLNSLGGIASKAMKLASVAVAAGATAVATLTTMAVKGFAEYEQLVGGVDTLFKDSSQKVQEYANNAYKTAGMSANKYMETVTSFSASLLQSLGGDTVKAAEAGNQAIVDMSDNANKMGTSMESIQFAYQGFAKQNYTMLDNLKLGYGGTKEEMARLLVDAEKLSGVKYDISNLSDVYSAIHVIQTELGITGTTAKEANTTIQGSLAATKSAFSNLVVGLADENANIDVLVENFIDSVSILGENLIPVVETAIGGIAKMIEQLAPVIAEKIPSLIEQVVPSLLNATVSIIDVLITALPDLLSQFIPTIVTVIAEQAPKLVDGAISLINALIVGIQNNLPQLVRGALEIVNSIVNGIVELLSLIIQLGLDLIISLAQGLSEALPTLIPTIVEVITQIVQILIDNLPLILDVALQLLTALAQGILASLPILIEALPEIINRIINFIISALPQIIDAGVKLFTAIVENLPTIISNITAVLPELIDSLITALLDNIPIIIDAGVQLLTALVDNLPAIIDAIVDVLPQIIDGIISALITSIPQIIDAGVKLLIALVDDLPTIINTIVAALPKIITALVDGIVGNIDKIINAGIELLVALVQNTPKIIAGIVKAVPTIIGGLIDAFKDTISRFTKVGEDLIKGLWKGIEDCGKWIWDKLSGFCSGIVDKVKGFFGIHSPSTVFAEIGRYLDEGLAQGITVYGKVVEYAINVLSKNIVKVAKNMPGQYKAVGEYYAESIAEGIKSKADQSIKAVEDLVNKNVEALIKKNPKLKEQYEKAGKETIDAYKKSLTDGTNSAITQVKDGLKEIADEFQKNYDDIIRKRDTMRNKLSDYGSLYKKDDNGKMQLGQIDRDVTKLKDYEAQLEALKARGVSDEFMNEVLAMGVDEGSEYMNTLLSVDDEWFKYYMDSFEEKQKLSKDIAERFYKGELDSLEKGFTNKMGEALNAVPKIVENIGKDTAKGFSEGMKGELGNVLTSTNEFAKAIINEMKRAFQIKSPSKVTKKEVGEMAGKGVADGIEESTKSAVKAAENQVDEIINAYDKLQEKDKFSFKIEDLPAKFLDSGKKLGEKFKDDFTIALKKLQANVNVTLNAITPSLAVTGGATVSRYEEIKTINNNNMQTLRVVADKQGIFKILEDENERKGDKF